VGWSVVCGDGSCSPLGSVHRAEPGRPADRASGRRQRAPDPSLVGQWIAEVRAEGSPSNDLDTTEVKALVAALEDANPADKAEAYQELGTHLTHHPRGPAQVTAQPRVYPGVCRRGELPSEYTAALSFRGEFKVAA